jgi:hypothetical protein
MVQGGILLEPNVAVKMNQVRIGDGFQEDLL